MGAPQKGKRKNIVGKNNNNKDAGKYIPIIFLLYSGVPCLGPPVQTL